MNIKEIISEALPGQRRKRGEGGMTAAQKRAEYKRQAQDKQMGDAPQDAGVEGNLDNVDSEIASLKSEIKQQENDIREYYKKNHPKPTKRWGTFDQMLAQMYMNDFKLEALENAKAGKQPPLPPTVLLRLAAQKRKPQWVEQNVLKQVYNDKYSPDPKKREVAQKKAIDKWKKVQANADTAPYNLEYDSYQDSARGKDYQQAISKYFGVRDQHNDDMEGMPTDAVQAKIKAVKEIPGTGAYRAVVQTNNGEFEGILPALLVQNMGKEPEVGDKFTMSAQFEKPDGAGTGQFSGAKGGEGLGITRPQGNKQTFDPRKQASMPSTGQATKMRK